jgi:hypothetical protein
MKKSNKNLSWTPFTDNLKQEHAIVDNELLKSIDELDLFSKAHLYGLKKSKGFSLRQVMFSVVVWPLLTVTSLHFFCGNRLSAYFNGGKDVMYDFLKRQNINWRGYRFHTAKQFYKKHELAKESIRAATFDDTIKHRRGKNVAAVSSHFDHTLCKHVMGQQVLEMGLSTPKAYASLDSQIYVGETKVQYGKKNLDDYRSVVGKDYMEARFIDKNQMLRSMLKRAIRAGINFTHVIADSWFGNRDNIKAGVSLGLVAIFRMKRGNLQYIVNGRYYTATELYALTKRRMKQAKGTTYRTVTLNVQLDLNGDKKNPDLLPVKLLFSSSTKQKKENWVVFLSTDVDLCTEKIFEIYALRWSIEVYFKEIKQHFGFLREQTGNYAVHYASIHLCAIRYMLVAHRMLISGESFGTVRSKITKQLELLTFARLLWELFKALIYGVLDTLKNEIPKSAIDLIKRKITTSITDFLDSALQLDERYMENELKAEAIGAL